MSSFRVEGVGCLGVWDLGFEFFRCLGFRLGFTWAEAFADSWKPTGNYEGGAVGAQSSFYACPTCKPDHSLRWWVARTS